MKFILVCISYLMTTNAMAYLNIESRSINYREGSKSHMLYAENGKDIDGVILGGLEELATYWEFKRHCQSLAKANEKTELDMLTTKSLNVRFHIYYAQGVCIIKTK